jgi:hypothetical protein
MSFCNRLCMVIPSDLELANSSTLALVSALARLFFEIADGVQESQRFTPAKTAG